MNGDDACARRATTAATAEEVTVRKDVFGEEFRQPAPTDDPAELADDGARVVPLSADRDHLDPAELADDGNRVVPTDPDLPDF
ncbi:MAG TPA: hypothetical protein VIL00_05255 [Pseudonocardiaceae bacterium]